MCVENASVTMYVQSVVENVNVLEYKKPSPPITVFWMVPIPCFCAWLKGDHHVSGDKLGKYYHLFG